MVQAAFCRAVGSTALDCHFDPATCLNYCLSEREQAFGIAATSITRRSRSVGNDIESWKQSAGYQEGGPDVVMLT